MNLCGSKRFQARIEKAGVNSYVDVPERVSLAFGAHARAGRIAVEGPSTAHRSAPR